MCRLKPLRLISPTANVTRLARRFPHIDILVNNAGAIPGDEVIEIDEATWRVAWEAEAREDANHSRS